MKIKKAVLPVAGFGTRFLPATKAMPKELLPIVDKPLIQYAAEEAIAAGVDTLIFVTGRNKRAIEDHFDSNKELELALRAKGKDAQADMVRNILPKGVDCIFVRQAEQIGLGDAVLCAERAVGGEPFAVLLADDFLIGGKTGVTTELVQAFEDTGKSQLSVMKVDKAETPKYGIVVPGSRPLSIKGLVEKPKINDAPSEMASIGRYILTPQIFDILHKIKKDLTGEVQLSEALDHLARHDLVELVELNGKRFDCGSIEGYFRACEYTFNKRNCVTLSSNEPK